MRKRVHSIQKTLQPFPAIVYSEDGDEAPSCYVIIDNIRYIAESPLSAVDLCFKSIQALHAQYPVQSLGPWLLLQTAIYNIHTEWDKDIGAVYELCKFFKAT